MAKKQAPPAAISKTAFFQNDRNLGFVLAGIAFLIYARTISFDFTLDDMAVIHQNKFVKDGFNGFGSILSSFYWEGCPSFATANSGIFRPLSLLLFATEWQFAPGSTKFFHLIHILLYVISSYQLFRLLRELFREYSLTIPLLTVLLWIVLPIHTEVTANVKSGDELLAVIFFCLSFRQLLHWAESTKIKQLILAVFYLFLALISKESALLFIPIILLGLLLFRNKNIKSLIVPSLAFMAIVIPWLIWHEWAVNHSGHAMIKYDYRNNALFSSSSLIDQIGTAIGTQALYWLKMTLGYPLSYNYSYNQIPVDGFAGIWCWIALLGISFAVFYCWKNFKSKPVPVYAILFYFIAFALTSNIFYRIGDTFAERFTFVPSIGFCLLISWLVLDFTKGLSEKRIHAKAFSVMALPLLIYTSITFIRSGDWKNDQTLMLADADHSPNSARALGNYGKMKLNAALADSNVVAKRNLLDDAYTHLKAAADIDSLDFDGMAALGQTEYHRGNYQRCVYWSQKSQKAFRYMSKMANGKEIINTQTQMNMGDAFLKLKQFDSAYLAYEDGMKMMPESDVLYLKMGDASLLGGDTLKAANAYQKAADVNPKAVANLDKAANVWGMAGKYQESAACFEKLIVKDASNLNYYRMLVTNYSHLGDTAKVNLYTREYYRLGGK
jgi:protein O-mannosyl-transferase